MRGGGGGAAGLDINFCCCNSNCAVFKNNCMDFSNRDVWPDIFRGTCPTRGADL